MKGTEIEKIADNIPKNLKGAEITKYLLERTFTKEQIDFMCKECKITREKLFGMTSKEIEDIVIEEMFMIEGELNVDENGNDIPNDRVDKASDILDVFSHW